MSEVVVHEPQQAMSLDAQMSYSKALAAASIIPKAYQNQPANILVAIGYAQALGEAPVVALTDIFVVEGKPSMSASMMHRRAIEAGHRVRVVADDQEATASIWRRDDPSYEHRITWTFDRAKQAGLTGKDVWKKYASAMLRARAISEVCRVACPEVLGPAKHTPDEIGGAFADAPEDAPAPAPAPAATTKVSRKAKPEPTPEPEPEPPETQGQDDLRDAIQETGEAPSDAQRKKMFASLRDIGLTERDDILEYVGNLVGREVESSNDLTRTEVHSIIDSLEGAPTE